MGRIAEASCYSAAMRARFVAQLVAALIVAAAVALDYLGHPVAMLVVLAWCAFVIGLLIEALTARWRVRRREGPPRPSRPLR